MIHWRWAVIVVAGIVLVALLWCALGSSAAGVGGAVATLGSWLWGRKQKRQKQLDWAIEIGTRDVAESNEEADKEIAHGMATDSNLADFVNGRIER